MKSLLTLIRLKQRELDVLRRQLAEQEQVLEALMAESRRLAEELEQEQRRAAEMPEMAIFYGKFAEGIEEKQEALRQRSREVNKLIRHTRNEIADAFGELKRFEITRDARLAEAEETANRQEQAELDEIGLQRFTRREEGGEA